jgi:hypothetical protein
MKTEAEILAVIEAAAATCSIWEFQQAPYEDMASLVHYIQANGLAPMGLPIRNYLEIGAGSGMVAMTMDKLFDGFDRLHVIDNNYYDFAQRDRASRLPWAVEWVGDSTTLECANAVAAWGIDFDFVLIDGGHTYEAVESDTFLIADFLAPGAFVAFHDKGWQYDDNGETDAGVNGWLAETASLANLGLTETPWRSGNTALYQYEAG